MKNHNHLSHGGQVVCSKSINGNSFTAELNLNMSSNPHFTARILMSYALCTHRLFKQGERGARTILDIPATALFDEDRLDIIDKYL